MGSEALSFKVNLPEEKLGLKNRREIRYRGQEPDVLTLTERAICDKIITFSQRKSGEGSCKMTFSQAQEEFDVARSTVGLTIKKLDELKLVEIERVSGSSVYRYVATNETGRYFYIPQFLYTIDVFTKKAPDVPRRLTVSQVTLLAYMMEFIKLGKGRYRATSSRIATELGLAESTVRKGLSFLISCDLIYRPEKWNKKGSKIKLYTINKDLYVYEKYEKKNKRKADENAQKQEQKPAYVPQEVVNANARSKFNGFYERRKAANEAAAERYTEFIKNAAPELHELRKELHALEIEIVTAEIRSLPTLPKLCAKYDELSRDRDVLYKRLKIDPAKFEPKYYAKCKLCDDTGERWSGGSCDCWKRRT